MASSIVVYSSGRDTPVVPPAPNGSPITYRSMPPVGAPNRTVLVTPKR